MVIYPVPTTSYSSFKAIVAALVTKHDDLVFYVTESTGTQVTKAGAIFNNTSNLQLVTAGLSGAEVSVFLTDFPNAIRVSDIGIGS